MKYKGRFIKIKRPFVLITTTIRLTALCGLVAIITNAIVIMFGEIGFILSGATLFEIQSYPIQEKESKTLVLQRPDYMTPINLGDHAEIQKKIRL